MPHKGKNPNYKETPGHERTKSVLPSGKGAERFKGANFVKPDEEAATRNKKRNIKRRATPFRTRFV
jgi:hypothetical protein